MALNIIGSLSGTGADWVAAAPDAAVTACGKGLVNAAIGCVGTGFPVDIETEESGRGGLATGN